MLYPNEQISRRIFNKIKISGNKDKSRELTSGN